MCPALQEQNCCQHCLLVKEALIEMNKFFKIKHVLYLQLLIDAQHILMNVGRC